MASNGSFESAHKAVLAEVTKQDYGLNHVEPPAELFSTTQAKLLLEVQGRNHELNRVENPPKDGLSEAEKQAYLYEKNSAQK